MPPIKVLIADSQQIARVGIRNILNKDRNITICHETGSSEDIVQTLTVHRPDILILDLYLTPMDGMTILQTVRSMHLGIKPIVFSNNEDTRIILECVELGAQAYLSKRDDTRELNTAIKTLLSPAGKDEPYMNKLLQGALWKGRSTPLVHVDLNEKQKQYLELFCKGLQKEEIAEQMELSTRTIEDYKYELFKKTHSKNDVMLVNYALEHGLHPSRKMV